MMLFAGREVCDGASVGAVLRKLLAVKYRVGAYEGVRDRFSFKVRLGRIGDETGPKVC